MSNNVATKSNPGFIGATGPTGSNGYVGSDGKTGPTGNSPAQAVQADPGRCSKPHVQRVEPSVKYPLSRDRNVRFIAAPVTQLQSRNVKYI